MTEIALDLKTPEEVSSKLTAIVGWLCEDHPRQSTGKLIADIIEDPSLPKTIRDAVFDAAEDIMNDLNRGGEMTLAWIKVYYDEAIREGRNVAE